MSNSRRSVLIPVLLLLARTLAPQTITDVSFLPGTFYIGDTVEVRILIRDRELGEIVIPEVFPDTEWLTFKEIVVLSRPTGVEVRVLFQPFFIGSRTMPLIDLGSVVLDGVTVFVTSILSEETRDLAVMRDQLQLPGTRLLLGFLVALLLVVPLTLAYAGGFFRRVSAAIRIRYRESMPYRRFLKQVKQLEHEVNELDSRKFYIRLMELVRRYLDRRFAVGVISSTTAELPGLLERTGIPEDIREQIVQVFRFGDLVKFASRRAGIEKRLAHLKVIRSAAISIHREQNRHVGA